ncbi:MAG: preprotein translocase subunit SecA [Verrucomicrobiota bacterium]|jgi:preprotein translocase subunit SecA
MIQWLLKKLIGTKNTRLVRNLTPVVGKINEIERSLQSLSDDQLRAKVTQWRDELRAMESDEARDQRLNALLPEAFAVVKNTARRLTERKHTFSACDQQVTWAMVHFDTQLIGGICLHRGMIAEMATGEGKTLVATLPLFLNALSGRGAHLVTTNDYLARRDAEWMSQIYGFLGLTTGIIQHDQSPDERRAQYAADITYGMNSEFGFDYLRDNGMASTLAQQVQRGHSFAIVDEVDSILIDEARTPLIISGPATVSTHQFDRFKPMVEDVVRKQQMLCNRLVSEADELWKAGKQEEYGRLLYKIKLGQPHNKGLLRAMEDAERRRFLDKAELYFATDTHKEEFFALKEELFFTIDERAHEADLSEKGRSFMSPDNPDAFVLPDLITQFAEIDQNPSLSPAQKAEEKSKRQAHMDHQSERIHNITQLLRAYCIYEKDVNYVVEEGKVVIVDEFTGRKMPGRRWSDGLHGAVEAKEGVTIDRETQTLATITIQNYFRLYRKLAGMTGTAETEANEFHDVYKLDVAVIPTNRPCVRKDLNDLIYKTRREKLNAVVEEIRQAHAKGQPVLVGTVSVEQSEILSRVLKREKVPHTVLNAKYHQQEAEIVARAGQIGAVTISTNMAGRGTDIKLAPGVQELGGLYVIGTERHESRRIDRQLRGRCARQGDPGFSRFFVSFEDDLMRNFGAAGRMTQMMERFGLQDGEALEHPWLNRSVETAQKRVEQRNYLVRKRSLEFDDVMNKQREVIYGWRNEAISSDTPRQLVDEVITEVIPAKVAGFVADQGERDAEGLLHWINQTFPLGLPLDGGPFETGSAEEIADFVIEKVQAAYALKCEHEDPESVKHTERYVLLNAIDRLWQEHLYGMDALREGVYLRAYGQKDPLVEFKTEAYDMFTELMANIKNEILHNLFRSTSNLMAFEHFLANLPQFLEAPDESGGVTQTRSEAHASSSSTSPSLAGPSPDDVFARAEPKPVSVGRNDPCPCGSGRKFKACCGKA